MHGACLRWKCIAVARATGLKTAQSDIRTERKKWENEGGAATILVESVDKITFLKCPKNKNALPHKQNTCALRRYIVSNSSIVFKDAQIVRKICGHTNLHLCQTSKRHANVTNLRDFAFVILHLGHANMLAKWQPCNLHSCSQNHCFSRRKTHLHMMQNQQQRCP